MQPSTKKAILNLIETKPGLSTREIRQEIRCGENYLYIVLRDFMLQDLINKKEGRYYPTNPPVVKEASEFPFDETALRWAARHSPIVNVMLTYGTGAPIPEDPLMDIAVNAIEAYAVFCLQEGRSFPILSDLAPVDMTEVAVSLTKFFKPNNSE